MSFWQKFLIGALSVFLLTQASFAQSGGTVIRQGTSGDLVSVCFTSSDKGFIGGDKGYLAYTEDGGRTWAKQPLTTTQDVNEIYFRNEDNGYLLAGSKIYITKDAGKSWRENLVINRNEFKGLNPDFLSVRFSGKKKGWIVGSLSNKDEEVVESLVLQTVDSGETWSRVVLPAKQELYHVDFVSDDRGWIVGDEGLIFNTENGGNSWTKQNSGVKESLRNVDFRDSDFGTVVGDAGTILRTENGGQSWDKINTTIKKSLLRVSFMNDKTGWIVGSGGVVLRTDDKGRTWFDQKSNVAESLYGFYADKKGGWAVGKKGIVIKFSK